MLLTGNGLKTPDAATYDVETLPAERGRPGLAPVIAGRFSAFEAWYEA